MSCERRFEHVNEANQKPEGVKAPSLPKRATSRSAGYDFYSPVDEVIPAGRAKTIWSNVKANILDDDVLKLYIRSSMAIKNKIMLTNQVGIVDSDYYNNPDNEGNIGISLLNLSAGSYKIKRGDRIAQGIIEKYKTVIDDEVVRTRDGGFGSTNKED